MINLEQLQQALVIASKCADDRSIPLRERNYFRAIAHLIWQSCQNSDERRTQ